MVIFSSRRRHTRYIGDWSSDVCSSDLLYAEMRDKAQAIGRKIIEAERDLDQAFATGRIDAPVLRSEERRVGKECRCRWWRHHSESDREAVNCRAQLPSSASVS